MHLTTEQRVAQSAVLSPRQRLFLRLVALPLPDLDAFLRAEAEENPFLEADPPAVPTAAVFPDVAAPVSFRDDLAAGARLLFDDDRSAALAEWIVENLDDAGYLRVPAAELARAAGADEAAVAAVAAEIRSRGEPPGIAARDLRESLLIQMERAGRTGEPAFAMVRDAWDDVAGRKIGRIARRLGTTPAAARAALDSLTSLSPFPAYGLVRGGRGAPVLPEADVVLEGARFVVRMRDDRTPVRVNGAYEGMLKDGAIPASCRGSMREMLVRARTLLAMAERRRKTLERVFQDVVGAQTAYFAGRSLAPLRERDTASRLGISVSTVSRAARGKYLATPRGVVAVKSLFSGVARRGVGSDAVRERIRELLAADGSLSDRLIAERLAGAGLGVSLRTVNKYRNGMGYLNSYLRR